MKFKTINECGLTLHKTIFQSRWRSIDTIGANFCAPTQKRSFFCIKFHRFFMHFGRNLARLEKRIVGQNGSAIFSRRVT